ncbi:MAG TPA: hydantoinase/oxoprolinase family protein [Acidimicrobiia bacterium]|nr:hydantoinase/oxoprolinase family protein [Acidimicrobiia bacterium]
MAGSEDRHRSFAVGVDIGGTFTDCVIIDDAGRAVTGKVSTTPHDPSVGFFGSIEAAAGKLALSGADVLGHADRVVHGTTTGTNALVARRGAVVALLTTAGQRDVLAIMRGGGRSAGRPPDELLDIVRASSKPGGFVPRRLIGEIVERVDADGDVVVPIDLGAARRTIGRLLEAGAQTFAVSLLWSIKNPAHEDALAELLGELAPGCFVSRASRLSGRLGEYERTTTAVMNAYIGPLMVDYVGAIERGAAERGFTGSVLFAQCAGGAITAAEAQETPILTVNSGPVAGVMYSAQFAARSGLAHVITADMGGTTFDVSVVRDATPLMRDVALLEGHELALPMLDVVSVGAGGGSIAWADASNRLNVGPQSAGAEPGPVCYGRGGTEPTVTDADLVLGILDPDTYLHGTMRLDVDAAEKAIAGLAGQLGLDVHATAAGINRVVDAKMADLIRSLTVFRGFDPRDFACLAFGGGGPVHAGAYAFGAGVRRVVVPLPDIAPVWSAAGAAVEELTHVFSRSVLLPLPAPPAALEETFRGLEEEAMRRLERDGFSPAQVRVERSVRMKHNLQVYDVEVPAPAGIAGDDGLVALTGTFETIYEQRFGQGSGYRKGGVQITGFTVRATGVARYRDLGGARPSPPAAPRWSARPVYWAEAGGFVETPVLTLEAGRVDDRLDGPLLVQLPETVVMVHPGQQATFDPAGNLVLTLAG